jgi:transposase
VSRVKQILAGVDEYNYGEAAQKSDRKSVDAVSHSVGRFNQEGKNAIMPPHGGRPVIKNGVAKREGILKEARRKPTPEVDDTANWSLSLLCQALRARTFKGLVGPLAYQAMKGIAK